MFHSFSYQIWTLLYLNWGKVHSSPLKIKPRHAIWKIAPTFSSIAVNDYAHGDSSENQTSSRDMEIAPTFSSIAMNDHTHGDS
jgi:hypothetical protein